MCKISSFLLYVVISSLKYCSSYGHSNLHSSQVFKEYIDENKRWSDSLNTTKSRSILEPFCNFNNLFYKSRYERLNNTITEDINIIIIGGADIEGCKYQDFCTTLSDTIYHQSNGTQLVQIVVCPINSIFKLLVLFKWPELLIRATLRLFSRNKKKNDVIVSASDAWIVGHSLGAYLTNDIASRFMRGFISIGSVKDMDLSSHSKPMLHIALENDGLMPLSVYSDIMRQSLQHPLGYRRVFDSGQQSSDLSSTIIATDLNSQYITSKSIKRLFQRGPIISNGVIVVHGVNHMQVAANQITRAAIRTHREDLLADDGVTLSVAHHRIASPIASFILSHQSGSFVDDYIPYNSSRINESFCGHSETASFSSDMQLSLDLLHPFIRAQDHSTDHDTVIRWQRYVLDTAVDGSSRGDNHSAVYDKAKRQLSKHLLHAINAPNPRAFIYSKASASLAQLPSQANRLIFTSDAHYYKTNAVECLMHYRGIPFSTAPTTMHIGHVLMVKMKSPAYIQQIILALLLSSVHGQARRPNNSPPSSTALLLADTCAFNEQTFLHALDMVPSSIKERYLRSGRKLTFAPDHVLPVYSGGMKWLTTPSAITSSNGETWTASSTTTATATANHHTNTNRNSSQFQSNCFTTPIPSPNMRFFLTKEIEEFLGVQYVKLISMSFALEWIYYWSRR